MILDSTRYESAGVRVPLPGTTPVAYFSQSIFGHSKPKRESDLKTHVLLANLADIVKDPPEAFVVETEMIDHRAANGQRTQIANLIADAFSAAGLEIPWGCFDQMGDTHSLNAFLDPMHANRRSVWETATGVRPIGACFTPFYIKSQDWFDRLTPALWRQCLRAKIELARAAGYERVYVTLTPYLSIPLAEDVRAMRTEAERNPLATAALLDRHYIGDALLAAGIDECRTYGDGVNIWGFRAEAHEPVLKLIGGMA